ncbi:hypothetical protein VdG2_04295 [Verticillium dahliae VDG2]|nr:hypothetical protein VdG2_04295 [Verticillium dahliae VDG2]
MSKRKAAEEAEAVIAKKLVIEPLDPTAQVDDEEYDDTTSYSADTAKPETVYTATTALSNRSRKFPSDFKTIKCTYPDCEKTFNRPARLAAHLRSHTDDRPYKCTHDGCDKTYREEKHLRQHVKGSHSQERSYVCTTEDCGKSFLTATRLRRHQESFRKHNTLQRHIRAEHQGVLRLGTEASADDTPAKTQPQRPQPQIDVADRPMPELPFLGVSQEIVYRDEADPLIRVPQDDDFWIGADDTFGLDAAAVPGAGQQDVAWQHDEAAMRALIDEDFSRFIDPALGEGMFAME